MDVSNDYVETSDAEELELIDGGKIQPSPHYVSQALPLTWTLSSPSPDYPKPTQIINDRIPDLEYFSPRKRIKLDHAPEFAFSRHNITPQKTQDLLRGNDSTRMTIALSPVANATQAILDIVPTESQDPIDFPVASASHASLSPSPVNADGAPRAPDKLITRSSIPESPRISPARSETQSLSQSWSLFSVTARRLTSPAGSSPPQRKTPDVFSEDDGAESLVDPQSLSPVFNEQPPPVNASSPLSEPDDSGMLEYAVENELEEREEPVAPHDPNDAAVAQQLEEEERQARYSFRSRQPRQRNPYMHDKIQYQIQMRRHPDAIVKFHYGESQRRHEQGGDSQEAWDMLQNEDDEDYEEEAPRPTRRRSIPSTSNVEEEFGDQGRVFDSLADISGSDDETRHAVRALLKDKLTKKDEEKRLKKMRKKRLQSFPVSETEPTEIPPQLLTPPQQKLPAEVFSSSPPGQIPVDYRNNGAPSSIPGSPGLRIDTDPGEIPPETPAPSSLPDLSFDGYFLQDDGHDEETIADFSYLDQDRRTSSARPRLISSASSSPERAPSARSDDFQAGEDAPLIEESKEDRKRRKILERMMPRVMARKENAGNHKRTETNQLEVERQQRRQRFDSNEDGTPAPGQARTRIGMRGRDIEIRGDSESSDNEISSHHSPNSLNNSSSPSFRSRGAVPVSDAEAVEVRPRRTAVPDGRHPSRQDSNNVDMNLRRDSDVINISSDSDEDSDDYVSETYYADIIRDESSPSRRRPMQERSQIDWMISRTRIMGMSTNSRSSHRTSRQPRQNKKRRLHVVTGGAKKYGTERQTLLPFKVASKEEKGAQSGRDFRPVDYETYDLSDDEPASAGDRKINVDLLKKRKKRERQGDVYHFQSESTRIASRYRDRARRRPEKTLVIDQSAHHVLEALDPAPKHHHASRSHPQQPPSSRTSSNTRHKAASLPFADIEREQSQPASVKRIHKRQINVRTDLNISFLPSGIRFAETTYLGKGYLYELVSLMAGRADVCTPPTFIINGLELGPSTSAGLFVSSFVPFCDRVADFAERQQESPSPSEAKERLQSMRSMTRLFSWLCSVATYQEFEILVNSALECSRGFVARLFEQQLAPFSPSAFWFVIELTARIMFAENNRPERSSFATNDLYKFIVMFMQHLRQGTLQDVVTFFINVQAPVETDSVEAQIAESWICIFHLLDGCYCQLQGRDITSSGSSHPFWQLVQQLLKNDAGILETGFYASERTWDLVFGLCALSQFNVTGMSTSTCRLRPSWSTVVMALGQIPLEAVPVINTSSSGMVMDARSVDTRDGYVAIIVQRCFLLWNRWHWSLEDALTLLNKLVEIFRSRNFANLRHERSDFMGFVLYDDVKSLSSHEPTDTACELFLKLVFQAARPSEHDGGPASTMLLPHARKALQLAVPVSSVHFTKASPPGEHEISMLINRFNAIAISIHVNPAGSNLEFRVRQAASYIDFAAADEDSRMVCIRAAMYLTIIARHHHLSIKPLTSWLADMTDVLVNEYTAVETSTNKENRSVNRGHEKERLALLVFIVLGCVRRIIGTTCLDAGEREPRQEYPDPLLLQGPWITRVFAPSSNLVISSQARRETCCLIQTFLDVRAKVLSSKAATKPLANIPESQEEYDQFFDNDFDEDELQKLDASGKSVQKTDVRDNEAEICPVIRDVITPTIYRLICKHLDGDLAAKSVEEFGLHVDELIDCWVGCGSVLVHNKCRRWSFFIQLGPQSWEKIINASWRRRVGLRFNHTFLRLDTGAYEDYSDRFIEAMLESSVSDKVTIENEYMASVINLDNFRHPLLQGLDQEITTPMTISYFHFPTVRITLIRVVLINIARCLRVMTPDNQLYVGFLVTMMVAMQDIHASSTDASHKKYGKFCCEVLQLVFSHPEIKSQPRLSREIAWGRTLLVEHTATPDGPQEVHMDIVKDI